MNYIAEAFKALEDVDSIVVETKKPTIKESVEKKPAKKVIKESKYTNTPKKQSRVICEGFDNEEWCIEMIHSIMAYPKKTYTSGEDLVSSEEHSYKDYLKRYKDELGRDRVVELAQQELDRPHRIQRGVMTDDDGLSYNSLIFDESKKLKESRNSGYYNKVFDKLGGTKITKDNAEQSAKLIGVSVDKLYDILDDLVNDMWISGNDETLVYKIPSGLHFDESLKEDTVKQNGKWVNKGKEGTHGTFKTKKAADAQRKAMFANGFKESFVGYEIYDKETKDNIKDYLQSKDIYFEVSGNDLRGTSHFEIDFKDDNAKKEFEGKFVNESCKKERKNLLKEYYNYNDETGELEPVGAFGCPDIEFHWINMASDPQIEYKGKLYNYYEVEDALWSTFNNLVDNGEIKIDSDDYEQGVWDYETPEYLAKNDAFDKWVKENPQEVYATLDDFIAINESKKALKEDEVDDEDDEIEIKPEFDFASACDAFLEQSYLDSTGNGYYEYIVEPYNDKLEGKQVAEVLNKCKSISEFEEYIDEAYDYYDEYFSDIVRDCVDFIEEEYDVDIDEYYDDIFDYLTAKVGIAADYDYYLDQDYRAHIFVDTGDGNWEYTLNPNNSIYTQDDFGLDDEDVLENASLVWLVKQQGYIVEDLKNVLNGGETNSKFLNSVAREVYDATGNVNMLAFLCKATLKEMLEFTPECTITINKAYYCGLFDPFNGGGSIFDIELEKPVVIPGNYVKDFGADYGKNGGYYSVDEVYGLTDKAYDADIVVSCPKQESLKEEKGDAKVYFKLTLKDKDGKEYTETDSVAERICNSNDFDAKDYFKGYYEDEIIKAEKNGFVKESKRFLKKKALKESETINLNDDEEIKKGKEILDKDEDEAVEKIVDVDADTVDKLKDSYIGNVILQCPVCRTLIYKKPDMLDKDEETELYNKDEECPHCGSKDGFELVGQVASLEVETKEDETLETTGTESEKEIETDIKDTPIEGPVEDKEKVEVEKEKNIKFESLDNKKFDRLVNKYLHNIYENVKRFESNKAKVDDKNGRLVVEGIVYFKDGKSNPTRFVFEQFKNTTTFKGLNEMFSKNKSAFTLKTRVENNTLICEALKYNYTTKLNEEKVLVKGKFINK